MSELPRSPGGMPTSPFEMEVTKQIVARRIEAGDIQQSDLDLLKKGYKWMTTASFLGSVGMAIPTYLFFRRKQPPASIGVKLLAAGGMGMLGSFLGFTVGGAAAAAEVNRSMENPQQKLRVFQEIATEARKLSIERSGIPSSSSQPRSPSGVIGSRSTPGRESIGVEMGNSTWASESALDRNEMAMEQAREGGYKSDLGTIRRDSGFATSSPNPSSSSPSSSSSSMGGASSMGGTERGRDGRGRAPSAFPIGTEADPGVGSNGGSWDQLRKGERGEKGQMRDNDRMGSMRPGPLPTVNTGKEGMEGKEDTRTAEQREFDALLERERRGLGGGDDKWA